ncbi:hypothetical protein TrLO_g14833 [Triparma laevis f. longispina]|uniref:GOLD domain-containing protein n=1 Tax=Triparma laevis f. longispina TaxID=1714387 RepID=A0A9W7FT29_9STRA|nr:hypothetical protein TrLO_g14833 [Triparma laevis f. longispina]
MITDTLNAFGDINNDEIKAQLSKIQHLHSGTNIIPYAPPTHTLPFPATMSYQNPLSADSLASFFSKIDQTSVIPQEATYKCSDVPVTYALELPIPVNLKGSTIRYSFTTEEGDVNFGVFLRKVDEKGVGGKGGGEDGEENEEEELQPLTRVDSHISPITGSFLVTEAPCIAVVVWDNNYSWFKSKTLSYSVTVKPPSQDIVYAKYIATCNTSLSNASIDHRSAETRLNKLVATRSQLKQDVERLKAELASAMSSLASSGKEESYLNERMAFRKKQMEGLEQRLSATEKK